MNTAHIARLKYGDYSKQEEALGLHGDRIFSRPLHIKWQHISLTAYMLREDTSNTCYNVHSVTQFII